MKDSMVFHRSFFEAICDLPKENQADLYYAIFQYVFNSKEIELTGLSKIIFILIKPQIDGTFKNIEKGENHWNWKNGITPKNTIIRQSSEMKRWRNKVFERDGYICRYCNKKGGTLHAHHIKPFSTHLELRFDIDNGLTLCKRCHNKAHSKSKE